MNVPIGKYTIEIEGNTEYIATSKDINITNEDEEDIITIFVGVKPRIETDFEFSFLKEDYRAINSSLIEAKAILLPD
jgi:hypothetical protein